MDRKKQDITYFISFCIEQYKCAKGMMGEDVVLLFGRYGVLEYLQEFFDVLHTQGGEWLVEDIDNFIKARG